MTTKIGCVSHDCDKCKAQSETNAELLRTVRAQSTELEAAKAEIENLKAYSMHERSLGAEAGMMAAHEMKQKLEGERAVLISLFRDALNVIETMVGESIEEQENLDALTTKMNEAINDAEYRYDII
jgi:hypothetical protein